MSKPRNLAANRPRSVTIQREHGGSFRITGASHGPPDGVPKLRRKARWRGSRAIWALLQAEGGSLTAQRFAAKLNVAPTTVYRWRRQRRLFAGKATSGSLRFPAWQIRNGGVLPGLKEVLAALKRRMTPLAITDYFLSPSEELAARPLDLLRKNRSPEVITHAQRYGGMGA